jgi:hypothetical protein
LYTTAILHGHDPGLWLTAVGIVAVIALCVWRLPRDIFGFFLGSASVIAVYDLLNKLSFYNAWALAGELALFAVVFGAATSRPGPTEMAGLPLSSPVPVNHHGS